MLFKTKKPKKIIIMNIMKYQAVIILEILQREIKAGSSPSYEFLKDLGYTFFNPEKKYNGRSKLLKLLPGNSEIIVRTINKLLNGYNLYTDLSFLPNIKNDL